MSGRDLYDGWYTRSTAPKPKPKPIPTPKPVHAPAPPKREEPAAPTRINVNGFTKWNDVNLQVTDLTISSNCCNDLNALDLNRFEWLRSIEIGDDCFGSVQTFTIDGLNRLNTINIGKNSFTQLKSTSKWNYDIAKNDSKSFHILNCESLESIQIGEYSFSDFAGDFELKNLPQLQSIEIGAVGSRSCNFCCSSFVTRGIDVILII